MESAVSLLQEHESQDLFALVNMAKIVPVLVRTIEQVPIQENMFGSMEFNQNYLPSLLYL